MAVPPSVVAEVEGVLSNASMPVLQSLLHLEGQCIGLHTGVASKPNPDSSTEPKWINGKQLGCVAERPENVKDWNSTWPVE